MVSNILASHLTFTLFTLSHFHAFVILDMVLGTVLDKLVDTVLALRGVDNGVR